MSKVLQLKKKSQNQLWNQFTGGKKKKKRESGFTPTHSCKQNYISKKHGTSSEEILFVWKF